MTALRVLVLVALASNVWADEPPGPDALERARQLYVDGSAHYGAGRYDEAIQLFLEAHRLSRLPAILFNLGQAYRLKGDCKEALTYYQRALAEEQQASNRCEIEERVRQMQECVRAAPKPEPP